MTRKDIDTGDLMAYIDGERLPHVEQALLESPELRRELGELERMDTFLKRNLAGAELTNPQDMVDVVTGQATPDQKLLVAAYVRRSAAARKEMQMLEDEIADLRQAERPRRPYLPRFIATRLALSGTRAIPDETREQSFLVVELQARITLRIAPPTGDDWQIDGYVTRAQQPAANVRVALHSLHSSAFHPASRHTDESGFFTFRELPEGNYRLQVFLEQGLLIVPDIILNDD